MLAAITPWPIRAERKAAISAATAEKHRSQRSAAEARGTVRELRDVAAQNNWAAAVADSLGINGGRDRNGHRNGGSR